MTFDFYSLRRGDALPVLEFTVSEERARAYMDATGEAQEEWGELVPPLALGALTLAGLLNQVPPPAGAVHTGQEFEFLGTVPYEAPLEARLSVSSQAVRQGTNVVIFTSELRCFDRVVVRGRTMVVAPLLVPDAVDQRLPVIL